MANPWLNNPEVGRRLEERMRKAELALKTTQYVLKEARHAFHTARYEWQIFLINQAIDELGGDFTEPDQ